MVSTTGLPSSSIPIAPIEVTSAPKFSEVYPRSCRRACHSQAGFLDHVQMLPVGDAYGVTAQDIEDMYVWMSSETTLAAIRSS